MKKLTTWSVVSMVFFFVVLVFVSTLPVVEPVVDWTKYGSQHIEKINKKVAEKDCDWINKEIVVSNDNSKTQKLMQGVGNEALAEWLYFQATKLGCHK